MTSPRSDVLSDDIEIYHCISRCVRRAFLCGFDVLTGRNFDHRKKWLRERLIKLSSIFCIDTLKYALMSSHQHLMIRTRPDLLETLSNEEVARRWLTLYPPPSTEVLEEEIKSICKDKKLISKLRDRLGNVSWYMKSVNEFMARLANKEDNCKGRFWEGRFKCQRLEDESAVFTCAMYIDLNPIRAKVARTPEESEFTSAFERIHAFKRTGKEDTWLAPLQDTKTRMGFLSVDLPTYLEILDETGRMLVEGKRGSIPKHLKPILERLRVKPESWAFSVQHYGKWFSRFAGTKESISNVASDLKKKWLKGIRQARFAFA